MKTEQEQIEKMTSIIVETLQDKRVENGTTFVTYLPSLFGNNHDKEKEVAEALIENGYGDVSEYKAEIEQLKAEVKQAQIDILDRVMTYINNKIENDYGDMSDSVNYLTIDIDDFDDFIDELIKEIENETV